MLQILEQRRLGTRLVILYTVVSGMVPAINADEILLLSGIKICKYYSNLTFMQLVVWYYFQLTTQSDQNTRFPYRQIPEFIFVITISTVDSR